VPGAATVPATGSAASAAETPLPPPGPTTLHLSITRTSWVEVYGDDRQRLVYGLLQPGTEQRVNGRPPYQIVLGHPQGVRMSLGGKVIDLTPYTERDGTARFKLKGP
jgi:cytoskeleton protein RodZ